jgi:uncharacterized membrane protein YbhN (UPF0104 family)
LGAATASTRPSRARWGLAVLSSLALLGLLAGRMRWGELVQALSETRPLPLGAGLLLALLIYFTLQPDRLRRVLAATGHTLGLRQAILAQGAAYPLANATPGKAGIAVVALWLSRRHGVPLPEGLSAFLLIRLHNLSVLLGMVLLGLPWTASSGENLGPWLGPAAGLWLGAVVLGVLAAPRLGRWLERSPSRSLRWVAQALLTLGRPSPGRSAALLAYAALILSVELLGVGLFFRAAGITLGPGELLVAIPLCILASNLPVGLGGLGTREAAVVLLLSGLAGPERALCASLLWSTAYMAMPALLGLTLVPALGAAGAAEPDRDSGEP